MSVFDNPLPSWDFNHRDDLEGWTASPELAVVVQGSCLWIRSSSFDRTKPFERPWSVIQEDIPRRFVLTTPESVDLGGSNKINLRVLNLSPETDGFARFRLIGAPSDARWLGPVRFTLQPYSKEWQDIVVHLDDIPWEGAIERVALCLGDRNAIGDIFVDRIEFRHSPARVWPAPVDVLRGDLPVVSVPGLSSTGVAEAFAVLQDAVVNAPEPVHGFPPPLLCPGADGACYGGDWWLLDGGIGIEALVWTAPDFARHVVEGYLRVQSENPDGRFTLAGNIVMRGVPSDLCAMPRFFESACRAVNASPDTTFAEAVYASLVRYLEWWRSPIKRDAATGLIMGLHEESFCWLPGETESAHRAAEVAQVDVNVAVAVGAEVTRRLALRLGRADDARRFAEWRDEIARAIETHLWNPVDRCYQSLDIATRSHFRTVNVATFNPLRLGIATGEHREALLGQLQDPDAFNWGRPFGLTSMCRRDPDFRIDRCNYNAGQWSGMVWTLRNIAVIEGRRGAVFVEPEGPLQIRHTRDPVVAKAVRIEQVLVGIDHDVSLCEKPLRSATTIRRWRHPSRAGAPGSAW